MIANTAPPPPIIQPVDVTRSDSARRAVDLWRAGLGDLSRGSWTAQTTSELAAVVGEAGEANWDGYGGRPVSPLTVARAQTFLELLPAAVPAPSLTVDPDGEISFEWYRGPRLLLSVSVGDRNELAYAGLFGASRVFGTEFFIDELPSPVLGALRRLFSARRD